MALSTQMYTNHLLVSEVNRKCPNEIILRIIPTSDYMTSVVTLVAFQSHGHVVSLTLKFFLLEMGET